MATTKKEVQILCKYSHKRDGRLTGVVTYAVRSSRTNERYYVTLVDGKATACNCPSRKTCYHITQLEKLEADRKVVATQFAAQSIPAWTMNLVQTGKLVAPAKSKPVVSTTIQAIESPLKQWVENKISTQELVKKAAPDMMKAALTTNRGFSLMR